MRTGTLGFEGSRLREVREVRQLQQLSLAEILGVTPQAISNYERGKSTPSPEILSRLANVLNVPSSFFVMPPRELSQRTVFYRSMSAATKAARDRAEHRASWLGDITCYVSEFVDLPQVNIPNMHPPEDPLQLGSEDIEQVAVDARLHWRMRDQPIGDMVTLLENQGVVVGRDRLGAATLDSLSEYNEEAHRPVVLIGTDKGTAARWRFDAAHELGHLILHRNLDRRRLRNLADHKEVELQAHRFAGAFLLPRDSFADELFGASLDAMLALKPRWRTSIAMMIMRARQTRLIDEVMEKRLWINYSRRGWRRNEPLDDTLQHETPRMLRHSLELILEAGAQAPLDVVGSTGLPASDIESLADLPSGLLSNGGYAPVALRKKTDWPDNVTPIRR